MLMFLLGILFGWLGAEVYELYIERWQEKNDRNTTQL